MPRLSRLLALLTVSAVAALALPACDTGDAVDPPSPADIDGVYTVAEHSYSPITDDTFEFTDALMDEVFLRNTTTSHVIATIDGTSDQITFNYQLSSDGYLIETWVFADGTLDHRGMRDKSVRDQVRVGLSTIYGSARGETYVIRRGEGSYTIHDFDPSRTSENTVVFDGLDFDDVSIVRYAGHIDMTIVDTGEKVRMYLGTSDQHRLHHWQFQDATYTWAEMDPMIP